MHREKIREDLIDGLGPWYWPEADTGAWDGPVQDWKTSHKETINSLKQKRVAIQAGGNCGLYPKLLSQMFEYVYTFEPEKKNFHFLKKNLEGIQNVFAYNHALGAEYKYVDMHISDEHNVGTHSINTNATNGEYLMQSLDQYNIERVDLLWYDIEGYEHMAILGSLDTIKRNLPLIGLERPQQNTVDILSALGYKQFTKSMMDVFYKHESK